MGLTSSLTIGRSALSAAQVAIQVTGNNFANASTPGYSRQIVDLTPAAEARQGRFVLGRGVDIGGIRRQVDTALQSRLWAATSNDAAASMNSSLLSQLEATINELSDNDLSSEFARFFQSWSELANSPNREGARALVVQQGKTLAGAIRALRSDLAGMRGQVDTQLGANVLQADNLLTQVADLNVQIVNAETGSATANGLRDQRDQLVAQLSELMDVSTIEQPNGALDVLVGSTPVVLNGVSRGIELRRVTEDGSTSVSVRVKADGTELSVKSGAVGGLLAQRGQAVNEVIDRLDKVSSQLIFQVNRIHSSGYSQTPITSVTGTRVMPAIDAARALNDPANSVMGALPFKPVNGGFNVTMTNVQTGQTQTVRVNVDLDGINSSGAQGFQDDTSVNSLAAELANIPNLAATVNADGTLSIDAGSGYTVAFSEDSSGVLAALGVNTYFTGQDASDIDIRQALVDSPGLLSTGKLVGGQPSDNGAALDIVGLRDAANTELGGESLSGSWRGAVQKIGADAGAAQTRASAAGTVRESLEAQRQAVSGVSLDEEAINLLNYQRMYQGAARFITAVDELTQTLLAMAG
jgi:flagellar hook-associated protein 1